MTGKLPPNTGVSSVQQVPARPPFSRPFVVDRLKSDEDQDIEIEANVHERAALAKLDGLAGIERLSAVLRVTRDGKRGARVVGEVEALVLQTCVVSLDDFPTEVREAVDVRFAPEDEVLEAEQEAARLADQAIDTSDLPDPPDSIVDGRIDLGAVAAEFLALGLDPYPRKPGFNFDVAAAGSEGDALPDSPFAALSKLKSGQ